MSQRMAVEVIGRDDDLSSLYARLDRRGNATGAQRRTQRDRAGGRGGIGKSTLWREVVEAAGGRGLRVLSSRPAESERTLAHAGFGDLFERRSRRRPARSDRPRRRALEVALLVEDATGRPVDPRALGVAVRSALELELLAEDGLVVAIDDLQWLDASSASALGFALRRLPDADILLIWTRRLGEGEQSSAVEDALEPDRIDRIRVGPLSVGAIHQLLHGRLSRTVARPTLLRLHEASGGNPFYALELARALGAEGAVRDPTLPLPVPERLEEARVRPARRLHRRDARSARARLRGRAADGARARGSRHRAERARSPALAENVIELERGTVRFTHPLLASVLYQGLSAEERQQAHGRLAEFAGDPVARARHLGPVDRAQADAGLATALEQAATAAAGQGAPIVAAELGEHALRLTPAQSHADADRRASAAAPAAHLAAGDVERARELADDLVARAAAGAERAEALVLMAQVESEDPGRVIPLLEDALREAVALPALRALIHQKLSLIVRFTEGLAAAEVHARASVELAEELEDDGLRGAALAGLAIIRFNAGEPGALELAEQAHDLASAVTAPEPAVESSFALAHVLVWSVHLERARALLESLYLEWSERDERTAAYALWYLALVELRAGRYAIAGESADRARSLNAQYARDEAEAPTTFIPMALVAAHRGDLELAREYAERGCRSPSSTDRGSAHRPRRWQRSRSGAGIRRQALPASRPWRR